MKKPINVFLDSDPGHDDAIAIMLAGKSPKLHLLGISTCTGNQTIEKTTRNALNICQYLSLGVPVAKGASRPLRRDSLPCPKIHGESGLDGFDFPPLTKKLDSREGYRFMSDEILSHDKVVLCPTGPLTNVALALTRVPEIKSHLKCIDLMGGSMGMGNTSPAAEFNIMVDPEAASIVFSSGVPIYMNGLDVTRQVLSKPSIVRKIGKIDNKASRLFVALMDFFNKTQRETFGWKNGAPLHDPVVIVSLLDRLAVHYEFMNVEIDVTDGPSEGRTNCDISGYLGKEKNAFVATSIKPERYWKALEDVIKLYDRIAKNTCKTQVE